MVREETVEDVEDAEESVELPVDVERDVDVVSDISRTPRIQFSDGWLPL